MTDVIIGNIDVVTVEAAADTVEIFTGNIEVVTVETDAGIEVNVNISNAVFIPVSETSRFVFNEVMIGDVDGVNKIFFFETPPATGKQSVFLNGVLQKPNKEDSSRYDYDMFEDHIEFLKAPEISEDWQDEVLTNYITM